MHPDERSGMLCRCIEQRTGHRLCMVARTSATLRSSEGDVDGAVPGSRAFHRPVRRRFAACIYSHEEHRHAPTLPPRPDRPRGRAPVLRMRAAGSSRQLCLRPGGRRFVGRRLRFPHRLEFPDHRQSGSARRAEAIQARAHRDRRAMGHRQPPAAARPGAGACRRGARRGVDGRPIEYAPGAGHR